MSDSSPVVLAGPARFLTELAAFFEAADGHVDDALADHFGFGALDWVIACLELLAETAQQPPLPLFPTHISSSGVHT
jgi:hypothetical protein